MKLNLTLAILCLLSISTAFADSLGGTGIDQKETQRQNFQIMQDSTNAARQQLQQIQQERQNNYNQQLQQQHMFNQQQNSLNILNNQR
jgi:hypothetical protein